MAREALTRHGKSPRHILDSLIQEHDLRPSDYLLFLVSGEGIFWPDDATGADRFEETSGYVLTRLGQVFAFWLGWDNERRVPKLTEWEEVQPEAQWAQIGEFRRARVSLGLPEP